MNDQDPSVSGPRDSLDALFPTDSIVRSFIVVCAPDLAVLARIAQHLGEYGAALQTFRGLRIESVMEYRFCLNGISEDQAQDIRASLQRLDGVQRVHLEHRIQVSKVPRGP